MLLKSEQAESAGPHNVEIEQTVLGSILMDGRQMESVISFLRPEHFHESVHARIYELCQVLFERDRNVSPITIAAFVSDKEAETWESIGGRAYLARLAGCGGLDSEMVGHARDIVDYWRRRQMIDAIAETMPAIENLAVPFEEAIDYIEDVSGNMRQEGNTRASRVSMAQAVASAMDEAEEASRCTDGLRGLSTGLIDLDRKLGGLDEGQMIVIAGRPSMGKSTLATNIARAVAGQGRGVLIGSIEMTARQLAIRFMSDQAFDQNHIIPYDDIKRGRVFDDIVNVNALDDARAVMSQLSIEVDENAEVTMPAFRATCRKAARQFERRGTPLGLIILDHMGLVSAPRIENPVARMTFISGETKRLAKHFGVPVLALSQLSRQVESRDDKRPLLSDLRESGAIEQDADAVIFTYRHEYYMERSKPEKFKTMEAEADWYADLQSCKNTADLIIAKNRQGPIGTVKTFCDITCSAFRDLGRRA